MESLGRSRSWIYFLVFAVLVAGTYWARKFEVRARDSARSAADGLTWELDTHLTQELATIRQCVADSTCPEPNRVGLPPGNAYNWTAADRAFWLMITDAFVPEYHGYYLLTNEWNAALRDLTTPAGAVLDSVALTDLLDGPLPDQLAGEIERAESELMDRRDRGRLFSRLYGWTWKLTLVGFIGLPIAMTVIEERRQRRMMNTHWKAQQAARKPPVTSSATRDVSA